MIFGIQFNCKCPYMFNWSQYINITKNKQPRSLLLQTLGYVKNKGAALDLGAGALNESMYLLDFGFKKVIAIDNEENLELTGKIDKNSFIFKKIRIENYDFLVDYFNLIERIPRSSAAGFCLASWQYDIIRS